MNTFLVFIPSDLYNEEQGYLLGSIRELQEEKVKSFYVLGKRNTTNDYRYQEFDPDIYNIIGYYNKGTQGISHSSNNGQKDWITLGLHLNELIVHGLRSGGNDINITRPCGTICIYYDYQSFMQTELLLHDNQVPKILHGNHFKFLTYKIKNQIEFQEKNQSTSLILKRPFVHEFINVILYLITFLLNGTHKVFPILKYISLGLHLNMFLESLSWSCKSFLDRKKISLKVGNFIVAVIIDMCIGSFILYWIMPNMLTSSLSQHLLDTAEEVVTTLRELLHWLMGIPAGLKLNYAFNNMLGRFFLYHINLWWKFLVIAKPFLEFTFHIFLCFGYLGLTFQVSILADLLALVSFHVCCIYVYAARLYNLQVSGLIALWRLFLGRKYNPLRDRVDSCQYTPDQLFVGTLAFTILLFLLPTTFMYYVVFTTLRILVIGLGGLLTRIRFVLQALPLYVTTLWLLRSTAVTSTVHLRVRATGRGPLMLSVRPVAGSWWRTVAMCIPDTVHQPPKVQWKKLVTNLVTGQFIYPV